MRFTEYLDGLKVLLIHHKTDCDVFSFSKPNNVYHDLTICMQGRMRYTVNGEPIIVNEGEAIYSPAGAFMTREQSERASYLSINFTTKQNVSLPLGFHLRNALSHEVNAYIEMLCYCLRKPDVHNDEKLFHLVSLVLLRILEQQEITHPMPYVDKLKNYIAENFQTNITLETVAKYVNLHPSYCSTIFKRNEGKSVTEYINTLRINYAKELLETTHYRVGEVGTMCGIPDPYYFSRVFSKICGISPTEYRKIAKTYGGKFYSYEKPEK